jgi:hypothetical protein
MAEQKELIQNIMFGLYAPSYTHIHFRTFKKKITRLFNVWKKFTSILEEQADPTNLITGQC